MNQRRLPWLTAVLLGLSALASAQDRVKPEGSGKPMLADVIDIAPWGHIGPEGQPVGVYASLFKRLSDLSACPLEQRLTPIPRAVTEVTRNVAQATIMLDRADLNAGAVELGEVTRLQIEVWLPNGSTLRSLDDRGSRKSPLPAPSTNWTCCPKAAWMQPLVCARTSFQRWVPPV